MRTRLGGAGVVLALACVIGCGRFGFDPSEGPEPDPDVDASMVLGADGSSPVADAGGFVDPLGQFNTPASLPELAGIDADDPSLRADLLEMFVVINGDIEHVVRSEPDLEFGGLRSIPELNSAAIEANPKLSPDGRSVFLGSERAGGPGGRDIYMATNPADRWNVPALVTELSSPAFDGAATATFDLQRVVFVSNRDGGLDLYESRRAGVGDGWEPPVAIAVLNSGAAESDPFISANGRELYFCSTRAGGLGGSDIYVATRDTIDDPFEAPRAMTELNSVSDDCGVWLSPDRTEIYFTSDRGGTNLIYRADR